ncbi:MAG: two-component system response regulator LytT [Flavobacteriales bacterium]
MKSAIIFTTAYDEYALRAFKLNSIDYILKPIDPEELQLALDKYKDRMPSKQTLEIDFNEIKKLLVNPLDRVYKKRFSIKVGHHLKLIDVSSIECFFVQNKGTYIHTVEGRDYLIDESLEYLSSEINPEMFFRANRKFYVNIKAIKDMIAYSNSRLKIVLNSFEGEEVIVAREKVKDFKKWLDS